ncbi:hypothetical protein L914_14278, partial [Phytophthora nicotianae]
DEVRVQLDDQEFADGYGSAHVLVNVPAYILPAKRQPAGDIVSPPKRIRSECTWKKEADSIYCFADDEMFFVSHDRAMQQLFKILKSNHNRAVKKAREAMGNAYYGQQGPFLDTLRQCHTIRIQFDSTDRLDIDGNFCYDAFPNHAHTLIEKQLVLEAHRAGREDWLAVARFNGIPVTTAYDIVRRGRVDNLPRGGAKHMKMTPEAKVLLEEYLNENCTYTLDTMRTMLFLDCGVKVDTSTISRHLKSMLFTVKHVRVEPTTCNSDSSIEKRRVFAVKLKEHQDAGNCIVYYHETNYNIYLKLCEGDLGKERGLR